MLCAIVFGVCALLLLAIAIRIQIGDLDEVVMKSMGNMMAHLIEIYNDSHAAKNDANYLRARYEVRSKCRKSKHVAVPPEQPTLVVFPAPETALDTDAGRKSL
jgi:hypothetical protein